MQAVLDTEYGGMNEVLYNLAAVTGDDKFAEAGDRFTKSVSSTRSRSAATGYAGCTPIPTFRRSPGPPVATS